MLRRPSIRAPEKSLYMQAPPPLEAATRPNLERPMSELVSEGEILHVTEPLMLNVALNVRIKWAQPGE